MLFYLVIKLMLFYLVIKLALIIPLLSNCSIFQYYESLVQCKNGTLMASLISFLFLLFYFFIRTLY